VHDVAFVSAYPFTWFLIRHFTGRNDYRYLTGPTGDEPEVARGNDRVKRIVTGNRQAIQELIADLAAAGEDGKSPENITVLPRHTMTVKVTVGKSLTADTAIAETD
jgi:hypothetical protein